MAVTVCKFGGSSVCSARRFRQVLDIIRSDTARRYIVLSAPGKRSAEDIKVTDLFLAAHRASSAGDHSILSQIYHRYAAIRDALVPEFDLEAEFYAMAEGIARSLDFALSRGEYLCARIFSAFSGIPFADAADIIKFRNDGSLDDSATKSCAAELLGDMPCAVIPGFYGSLPSKSIKTFGRGGSDVSGAVVAAALNADLYENWTDVDGLFTADPAIVPDAERNPKVNLAQMERIARAGATLLHPDALIPLRGTGIDTVIKNSFHPDACGTRISEGCRETVRCVTGSRSVYISRDGSGGMRIASAVEPGAVHAALVNVFGADAAMLARMQEAVHPLHLRQMQDYMQLIVPAPEYERTVRTVHSILTGKKSPGAV